MQTIYEASILLVDDNPDLLVLVGDSLRTAGYTCIRTAATCAEARALFAAAAPELMILDINLPDGDGFTLLRQLHAKADVPALFLSARDADADRLLGLGLGADDYLTKPFLMQELLLRVQRILQRAYRAELCRAAPPALELGDCQVDLADAAVYRPDGVTLPLTATELGRGLLRLRERAERAYPPPAGKAGGKRQPPPMAVDGAGHRLQAGRGGAAMKTFARLIRRYVLATAGIILVVVALLLGMTIYAGVRYNDASDSVQKVGALAEALHPTADGLQWDAAHTPAEWMHGYAWAMVLDEDGNVIWQQDLPEALNHRYTASNIAVFSRWYLADYPVQCWAADYGLFVAAEPVGSQWKYNITAPQARMEAMVGGLLPVAVLLLAVVLGCCLWFSWRGARHLQAVADGLDTLAKGGAVQLPTTGFAGELAEKLNETGEQLRRRNEIIARRDTARTDWIAGVSHDIRTPLALILGWGEQLQQDEALPAAARQKAAGICTQSEKIRSLIGDLNLTSKLQYGAQPLRRKAVTVGPFLRRCAAEFYESPAAGDSTLELELTQAAEHTVVQADEALLLRAIENLLHNTVGHNAAPVHVTIRADAADGMLTIQVTDDGQGYPPAVLAVLQAGETGENPPHILGLHVVEQILAAHGGTAAFAQALPHGAAAALTLPL